MCSTSIYIEVRILKPVLVILRRLLDSTEDSNLTAYLSFYLGVASNYFFISSYFLKVE